MNNFICVMNGGGAYDARHVRLLYRQLLFTQRQPFKLHCLTNKPIGHSDINEIPLEHDLRGYWSKLEIFKHFKRGVYLDLDLIITDDISELFSVKTLTMLEDAIPQIKANSSVIALNGEDHSSILETFLSDIKRLEAEYSAMPKLGDQSFIADCCGKFDTIPIGNFHAHFKNQISAKIINCHGKIKPWSVSKIWAELLNEA